ncbi:hypothetical protein [Microbacterium sp. CIAB417]|uniref:DUF6630 family protein n=1 Tax=Microbacterium sp. CIAB417 TaxID=2860287 RepID=UPI001FAD13B7|nr:hypothetical protein [Microbacterium sp. CIAB417]
MATDAATGRDWARLCALIDDDAELAEAVRTTGDDPWEALIDGLDDAGALAYLDEEDAGPELAEALAGLPRVFRAGADLDTVEDIDGDLVAAIVRADAVLAPHGLRLVHLEEEPDAHPLVAVPIGHVDEIIALAARLGHRATSFL